MQTSINGTSCSDHHSHSYERRASGEEAGDHVHSHHVDDNLQASQHSHIDDVDALVQQPSSTADTIPDEDPPIPLQTIATAEAVEKLQDRFNQLMGQVADLTDEKQRLEHLVLQLQGETETIGEYIALYQNQRRMLKQREYERAAQTQMLQDERKQMQERLLMLNNLVSSLGLSQQQQQQVLGKEDNSVNSLVDSNTAVNADKGNNNNSTCDVNSSRVPEVSASPASPPLSHNLNSNQPSDARQEILGKIHQIINDIQENNGKLSSAEAQHQKYNAADHLQCCSGKFEVV